MYAITCLFYLKNIFRLRSENLIFETQKKKFFFSHLKIKIAHLLCQLFYCNKLTQVIIKIKFISYITHLILKIFNKKYVIITIII